MVLLCRRLYGSPETPTPNTENLPHTEQGPSWPFVLAERISLIKNDKELSPELGNVPRWMLREAAAGGRTRGALRLPCRVGRLTVAGCRGGAPAPRGRAPWGLSAAGQVPLLTAHGAGGVVAEAPQRVGANQAPVRGGLLLLTGHD